MNWKKDFEENNNSIVSKTESAVLDFIELISLYMRNNNINQKQLAEILKMSDAAVSKLLSGNENLSIKRMVEISDKLKFNISIVKNDESRVNISIDKSNAELMLKHIINKSKIIDVKDYLSCFTDTIIHFYFNPYEIKINKPENQINNEINEWSKMVG